MMAKSNKEIIVLTENDLLRVVETDLYKKMHFGALQENFLNMEFQGREYKIFLPILAYIFVNKKLPYTTKKNIVRLFDGTIFQKPYIIGYEKGLLYFEKNFAQNPKILYGPEGANFIRSLHQNVFHRTTDGYRKGGWNYWRLNFESHLTEKNMERYGYYAGLMGRVYDLKENHTVLFRDFHICNKGCKAENKNNEIVEKGQQKKGSSEKKRPSERTLIKYRLYVDRYKFLNEKEKMPILMAEAKVREEFVITQRTLNRARQELRTIL